MAYKLSEGALSTIMSGGEVQAPVMQILGTRKMSGSGSGERYRLLVSDGLYVNSFAMLATQLNEKILANELDEFTIIRIGRYITSMVPNSGKGEKRVMIILDLEVISPGSEVGQRIGNPQALGADGQPPPAAAPVPAPIANASSRTNGPPITPTRAAQPFGRRPLNQTLDISPGCQTHPIASLTPYQNKWVIKARVTNKNNIRTWSNARGEGKLFAFDVIDESGEIRITAFKEQCDKFYDMIELGKVYLISRATLKPANKQFSSLKNDYEMTLNAESQVVPVTEDVSDVPKASFNFVPLSDIEAMEPNTHVDVIGICRSFAELMTFTARTSKKEVKKRELSLVDQSLASVTLTLWGNQAEEFNNNELPVIAVKGGSVNEFNGAKSISLFSSSTMMINPDIPEAHQLRGWYDNEGNSLDFKNVSQRTGGMGTDGKTASLGELKILQAEQGEAAGYYTCKATVVLLKSENAIYPSCSGEGCNKKVVDLNNGMYRCEKCNREYTDYSPRLLLSMGLADWSSHQWVTCFHEVAEEILGSTAMELNSIRADDPETYQRTFTDATFKSYMFRLRAQEQSYNDEKRMKVTVVSAKEVDHAAYAKRLLGEMKELYESA